MSSSTAFEWMCDALQAVTDLDRLQARGTVRIALRNAGLDAASFDAAQARVVLQKLMPAELEARGIANAAALCRELEVRLSEIPVDDGAARRSTPEEVFSRLG